MEEIDWAGQGGCANTRTRSLNGGVGVTTRIAGDSKVAPRNRMCTMALSVFHGRSSAHKQDARYGSGQIGRRGVAVAAATAAKQKSRAILPRYQQIAQKQMACRGGMIGNISARASAVCLALSDSDPDIVCRLSCAYHTDRYRRIWRSSTPSAPR